MIKQDPESDRLRHALSVIHEITQDTNVSCWQALQNIAATASAALHAHGGRHPVTSTKCDHPRKLGGGSVGGDGSWSSYWTCLDCGASESKGSA